jgi:tryptophanyl-tRNA synthetase
MSLKNANEKMSKSNVNDSTRINLTDTADEISAKIRRATTDSTLGKNILRIG